MARVKITEAKTRWQPPDVILEKQLIPTKYTFHQEAGHVTFTYDRASGQKKAVRLTFNPFKVDLYVNDISVMTLNAQNLFHFEHTRRKDGTVVTDDMDAGGARSLASSAAAAAKAGDAISVPEGKKIVDYNEHGHAIYDDGSTSADVDEGKVEGGDTPPPADVNENEPTEGSWEESFGGHTDTKPHGPQSVGMDITFNGITSVFGIPEHATKFSLKSTDGSHSGAYNEPYRLYNLDVFEYDLDVPMALYGAIPLMVGHNKDMVGVSWLFLVVLGCSWLFLVDCFELYDQYVVLFILHINIFHFFMGLDKNLFFFTKHTQSIASFWFNPTETFIDIKKTNDGNTESHWISEAGLPDIFMLPGPDVRSLYRQYAQMTGTSQLPPLFSLGYHQCRWNYRDEAGAFCFACLFCCFSFCTPYLFPHFPSSHAIPSIPHYSINFSHFSPPSHHHHHHHDHHHTTITSITSIIITCRRPCC